MKKNSYWLLTEKRKRVATQVIAELTADGMVYIWPLTASVPKQHLPLEQDQDPEALQIDGDFLGKDGFFQSIADFLSHSRYTVSDYDMKPLGEFESIRSCRQGLLKDA